MQENMWDGMKNHIKQYIEQCSICAPSNETLPKTGTILDAPTETF